MLCALLVGLTSAAQAYDPINVTMALSKSEFTGPDDVTVTIKVSNVGDDSMPGPVYLNYPNGKPVTEFGDGGAVTLGIAGIRTWTGTWRVTQKQLEDGKIVFSVKYPVPTEDGTDVYYKTKTFNKAITYNGAQPGLTVKRSISSDMARKDQKITITYDLSNTGNVTLTNIKLTENKSISSKTATIKSLAANASEQVKFEVTMGSKNLTSSANITYKATGSNETLKYAVDAKVIQFGEAKLTAAVTASSSGVSIGETIKLTVTLKNQGNTSYNNISISDLGLGEIASNLELPAGQTKIIEKDVIMLANSEYVFTVQATDNTGSPVTVSTEKVAVNAVDPNKQLKLTVNATADKMEIYSQPAQVRFDITVTNSSEIEATNVTLRHGSTVLYTFPSIKAGESKRITRDTSISMAGEFRFTAACKDLLNKDVTFDSNPIHIAFSVPTPEPTNVPQRTPAPLVTEPIPTSAGLPAAFTTAKNISLVLFGLFLVLLAGSLLLMIIAFAKRLAQKRQSEAALDHLERGIRRDYTSPSEENFAEAVEYNDEGDDGDGSKSEPTFSLDEDELPHMKYVRGEHVSDPDEPYEEDDDQPHAEEMYHDITEEEAAILSGGTGHYRLARTVSPAYDEDEKASATAAGYARRRRTARTNGEETPLDT